MENPNTFLSAQSQMVSSEVEQWFMHTTLILPNWKWLALVIAIVVGIILRPLLQYSLGKFKSTAPDRWKNRKNFGFYFLSTAIEQPISWLVLCFAWNLSKDAINLSGNLDKYTSHILTAVIGYYAIKTVYLAVDALGNVLKDIVSKTESTVDDQLAPFATKTLKILVVVLGALMIFQGFGLNVVSLLAGLGLGGLALALAAQDTVANLFGSITILMDHPFKIGDWVKVQDVEGTVEEIGFRSTRIRTFYNSIITIPNAIVAKDKIDNMGERPSRRIRHTLDLHYNTSSETIRSFCDAVVIVILKNEKVIKPSAFAYFNGYGASSLNVMVNFNALVIDGDDELRLQQTVLLDILDLAKNMNVEFAYPTRTIYHRAIELASVTVSSPAERP